MYKSATQEKLNSSNAARDILKNIFTKAISLIIHVVCRRPTMAELLARTPTTASNAVCQPPTTAERALATAGISG